MHWPVRYARASVAPSHPHASNITPHIAHACTHTRTHAHTLIHLFPPTGRPAKPLPLLPASHCCTHEHVRRHARTHARTYFSPASTSSSGSGPTAPSTPLPGGAAGGRRASRKHTAAQAPVSARERRRGKPDRRGSRGGGRGTGRPACAPRAGSGRHQAGWVGHQGRAASARHACWGACSRDWQRCASLPTGTRMPPPPAPALKP